MTSARYTSSLTINATSVSVSRPHVLQGIGRFPQETNSDSPYKTRVTSTIRFRFSLRFDMGLGMLAGILTRNFTFNLFQTPTDTFSRRVLQNVTHRMSFLRIITSLCVRNRQGVGAKTNGHAFVLPIVQRYIIVQPAYFQKDGLPDHKSRQSSSRPLVG